MEVFNGLRSDCLIAGIVNKYNDFIDKLPTIVICPLNFGGIFVGYLSIDAIIF